MIETYHGTLVCRLHTPFTTFVNSIKISILCTNFRRSTTINQSTTKEYCFPNENLLGYFGSLTTLFALYLFVFEINIFNWILFRIEKIGSRVRAVIVAANVYRTLIQVMGEFVGFTIFLLLFVVRQCTKRIQSLRNQFVAVVRLVHTDTPARAHPYKCDTYSTPYILNRCAFSDCHCLRLLHSLHTCIREIRSAETDHNSRSSDTKGR